MDQTHHIYLVLLNLCWVFFTYGGSESMYYQRSPAMYEMSVNSLPMVQPQFRPMARDSSQGYPTTPQENMPQEHIQPMLHNMPKSASTTSDTTGSSKINTGQSGMTQRDYYYRAGKNEFEYPPHQSYPAPPYGFTAPSSNYSPASAPASSQYTPAHHPQTSKVSSVSFTKPDISLIKPAAPFSPITPPINFGATTKVASKISGLISLVLTLLTGSSTDEFEVKGFTDIVINGIVKPLLLAKSGIKSLISKLTIPLISLLLINLEVLVTIWWLWEECPQSKPYPDSYSYPNPTYQNPPTSNYSDSIPTL